MSRNIFERYHRSTKDILLIDNVSQIILINCKNVLPSGNHKIIINVTRLYLKQRYTINLYNDASVIVFFPLLSGSSTYYFADFRRIYSLALTASVDLKSSKPI
jgi:hypothetical protein